MSEWITVARAADVPEGAIVGAVLEGEEVVVVNAGGRHRVLGAICTQAGCNLAEDSELEDDSITCLCHGSLFDLESGAATGPPAEEPLPVYEVRVAGDRIQVTAEGG